MNIQIGDKLVCLCNIIGTPILEVGETYTAQSIPVSTTGSLQPTIRLDETRGDYSVNMFRHRLEMDVKPKGPTLVILESPYAGDVELNVAYARRCLHHSVTNGEAPIASHLLYTQVLDDNIPEERQAGIEAGLAWRNVAEATVVYEDLGITKGMRYGIEKADADGKPIDYRRILKPGEML